MALERLTRQRSDLELETFSGDRTVRINTDCDELVRELEHVTDADWAFIASHEVRRTILD